MGIFDNPGAFEPMFDEIVKITAPRQGRTIRGSYSACTFPIRFDDPFDDDKIGTTRQRFTVMIAKTGSWAWNDRTPPQVGDEIVLTSGMKTSVVKVISSLGDYYEMEARQC